MKQSPQDKPRQKEQKVYKKQAGQKKRNNYFLFVFISFCFSFHLFSLPTFFPSSLFYSKTKATNVLNNKISYTKTQAYPLALTFFPKTSENHLKKLIHAKPFPSVSLTIVEQTRAR